MNAGTTKQIQFTTLAPATAGHGDRVSPTHYRSNARHLSDARRSRRAVSIHPHDAQGAEGLAPRGAQADAAENSRHLVEVSNQPRASRSGLKSRRCFSGRALPWPMRSSARCGKATSSGTLSPSLPSQSSMAGRPAPSARAWPAPLATCAKMIITHLIGGSGIRVPIRRRSLAREQHRTVLKLDAGWFRRIWLSRRTTANFAELPQHYRAVRRQTGDHRLQGVQLNEVRNARRARLARLLRLYRYAN